MSQTFTPLLLRRSISYPAYQLRAIAGGYGTPPEVVLKICILETMQWLRPRFRAFELPEELNLPESSRHAEVRLEQFRSFHLDLGYRLEVVWLPDTGIWTLQLTEPDLGSRPDDPAHSRLPAPGRLIETNVSFNRTASGVTCGFRTVIHQPEDMPQDCEVFRYAFIKLLARNPSVGLTQHWKLTDAPLRLDDPARFRHFLAGVRAQDRTMPVVVLAEHAPPAVSQEAPQTMFPGSPPLAPSLQASPQQSPHAQAFPVTSTAALLRSAAIRHDFSFLQTPPDKIKPVAPSVPEPLSGLARYRLGYAHFFVLPAAHRKAFIEQTGLAIENGGVLFCEPFAVKEKATAHPHEDTIAPGFAAAMEDHIQNYLRGKKLPFDGCTFLEEARGIEFDRLVKELDSKEELAAVFQEKLRTTVETARRQSAEVHSELNRRADKLNARLERLEEENRTLRANAVAVRETVDAGTNHETKAAERMRMLRDRPLKPAGVPEWIDRWFSGRLVCHDKARRLIKGVPVQEVDLPLLLDALEYLGVEYWETLQGIRSEQERDNACSRHYERPFSVTPLRGISTEAYAKDYRIPYGTDAKGNPTEMMLDLHLRVGNDPQNLLRIYFFYDKPNQCLVIGSMPKHLPTINYA